MFGELLLWLLKVKVHALTAAKIPLIASLLVLGSTGFIVTGVVQGDEGDDHVVRFTITPLASPNCLSALIARTEAQLEVDVLAGDAQAQLRHMRDRARSAADELDRTIDETALGAKFETFSGRIRDEVKIAQDRLMAAANLNSCEDPKPGAGVAIDVAALRNTYDTILREFGQKLRAILDEAQTEFDRLVATAQPRPRPQRESGSSSRD